MHVQPTVAETRRREAEKPQDKVLPEVQQKISDAGTSAGAPGRVKSLAKNARDIGRGLSSNLDLPESAADAPRKLARAGSVYKGGLGVLGTAGSGLQFATGVKQFANGNVLDGAQNSGAGALNGAAGATGLSSRASGAAAAGLRALGAAESIGSAASKVPVAAPIAGAAGVVTGGVDAYQGIRDGQAEKAGLGGAKAIGGGLLVASAFAGPAAPVLALAGGAVLAGATAYEHRKVIGKAAGWVAGKVGAGASWAASRVGDGADLVADRVADRVGAGVGALKSGAGTVAGGVSDLAGGAKDLVGELL